MTAFDVIALDQAGGRVALHDSGEFPAEVVDILHPAIAAPCAKRADHMGAVPDKDHAALHELLQPCAAELIDAHPIQPERRIAQHLLQTRQDFLFGRLGLRVGLWPQLQIDAVDIVGLFMQQRGLPVVKGWGEPEPTLGCVMVAKGRGFHLYVGD